MEIFDNINKNLLEVFNTIFNSNNISLILIILFILFLGVLYIVNFINPFDIKNNKFTIIAILAFIFLELQIFFYYLNNKNSNFKNYKKIFSSSLLIITIILSTIYIIFFASRHFFGKNLFSNIILIFLQAFLVITVLSIIYLLSENKFVKDNAEKLDMKNMNNPNYRFIKNLIFFIPCLLIDVIENIGNFFGSTPKIGYILLLLTIILVIAILKLPNILNKLFKSNNLLLKGPIYLNNKKEIGVFQEFTRNNIPKINNFNKNIRLNQYELDIELQRHNENNPFSYNYELESEIYINPQPSNTSFAYNEFTNLLNYGNKPKIEYLGKENKIKISCQTDKNKYQVIYESKITNNSAFRLQRWNHVKIKYDGANMDVFINSHLVGTQRNIIPHMNHDKVIIGENNGIHGGIKNVYFYTHNKPAK
tara:strand:- start:1589 stop:2851 length:1263 start_codon:yes stop_codon:yes gene_type:complete